MNKIFLFLIAIMLFLSCNELQNSELNKQKNLAPTLYYNGNIITMDTEEPTYAEAIVEQDGKIAFVGALKEAEKQFSKLNKIDLNGKTLLPGFIDPHSHFGMVSNTIGQVDLNPEPVGTVKNIDDILANLKKYKEEKNIADGEWIFGWGYDDGELAEKRHPTKKDIDKVLPNNPVYLQHTSGHMGVANTMGLAELKVNAETKNPEVRINAVGPGATRTAALESVLTPEIEKVMLAHTPIKRLGKAEDIAGAMLYFASPISEWVSGQTIFVNGGGEQTLE